MSFADDFCSQVDRVVVLLSFALKECNDREELIYKPTTSALMRSRKELDNAIKTLFAWLKNYELAETLPESLPQMSAIQQEKFMSVWFAACKLRDELRDGPTQASGLFPISLELDVCLQDLAEQASCFETSAHRQFAERLDQSIGNIELPPVEMEIATDEGLAAASRWGLRLDAGNTRIARSGFAKDVTLNNQQFAVLTCVLSRHANPPTKADVIRDCWESGEASDHTFFTTIYQMNHGIPKRRHLGQVGLIAIGIIVNGRRTGRYRVIDSNSVDWPYATDGNDPHIGEE